MCSLLLQMGADARDIRGEKATTFPVIKQWLAKIDENTWTPKSEPVDTIYPLNVPYIGGLSSNPSIEMSVIHANKTPIENATEIDVLRRPRLAAPAFSEFQSMLY